MSAEHVERSLLIPVSPYTLLPVVDWERKELMIKGHLGNIYLTQSWQLRTLNIRLAHPQP